MTRQDFISVEFCCFLRQFQDRYSTIVKDQYEFGNKEKPPSKFNNSFYYSPKAILTWHPCYSFGYKELNGRYSLNKPRDFEIAIMLTSVLLFLD